MQTNHSFVPKQKKLHAYIEKKTFTTMSELVESAILLAILVFLIWIFYKIFKYSIVLGCVMLFGLFVFCYASQDV